MYLHIDIHISVYVYKNKQIHTYGSSSQKKYKRLTKIWKNTPTLREMPIKTTLRFHFTPCKLAKMTKDGNSQCWRSCGKIKYISGTTGGTLKSAQPFWKTVWNYANKTTIKFIPFDPKISSLCLSPKETKETKESWHICQNI